MIAVHMTWGRMEQGGEEERESHSQLRTLITFFQSLLFTTERFWWISTVHLEWQQFWRAYRASHSLLFVSVAGLYLSEVLLIVLKWMHSMLKQSIPLATIDNRNGPVLPPLSTLPQWTRVNNLSRLYRPRPPMKDQLQHLPDCVLSQKMSQRTAAWDDGASDHNDTASLDSSGTSKHHMHHLERAVVFLQQQHNETLSALHNEVDRLKRENRGVYVTSAASVVSLVLIVTENCIFEL